MPYDSNDSLPPTVKKLSDNKRAAWRAAFNSAHASGEDEATCFKIAWAAAGRAK